MAIAVPRMPVLIAVGPEITVPVPPVEPVLPELPETASGLDVAVELALPVLPVLVALLCDDVLPELPDSALGLTLTNTSPPSPPPASITTTERSRRSMGSSRVGPLGPGTMTMPPAPPSSASPPTATMFTRLLAAPVNPEMEVELAPAPELALLIALPTAMAGPVDPEFPELPVKTGPPMAIAVPRMAVFTAVGLDMDTPGKAMPKTLSGTTLPPMAIAVPSNPVLMATGLARAPPEEPVDPECPDIATGLDTALELALPVSPVLVALD